MFPEYPIDSITNGVHAATWTAPTVPQRCSTATCRAGATTTLPALRARDRRPTRSGARTPRQGRAAGRRRAAQRRAARSRASLRIGFARRATAYKRADLLFSRPRAAARDRAKRASSRSCTPARRTRTTAAASSSSGASARAGARLRRRRPRSSTCETTTSSSRKLVVAGVDLWLNKPMRPLEASGTQRDEGGAQRRPQLQRARRLVDRRLHRGRHRLGDRQAVRCERRSTVGRSRRRRDLYLKLETAILPLFYRRSRSVDRR